MIKRGKHENKRKETVMQEEQYILLKGGVK
jgi:hypothetical protein